MASYTLQGFTNDASSADLDATNLNEMDNAIKKGHDFADGASPTPSAGKAMVWPENASGTFTPTITFGGESTGITYTRQFGRWQRIGNRIDVSIAIGFSSKGSATGQFLISGLPISCGANQEDRGGFQAFGTVQNIGYLGGLMQTVSNSQIMLLTYDTTGAEVLLNNTNFTDTSTLRVVGSYYV